MSHGPIEQPVCNRFFSSHKILLQLDVIPNLKTTSDKDKAIINTRLVRVGIWRKKHL